MPAETFAQTTGSTIRAEMNSGRISLPSQISARMMKDTTGVLRTSSISGENSALARLLYSVRMANSTPRISAARIPPRIRSRLSATLDQNAPVSIMEPSF